LREREGIGHHSPLAEPQTNQLARMDGVAGQSFFEKGTQLADRRIELVGIGGRPHRNGKPAVATHRPERDFKGPLRTQEQEAPVSHVRSEAEKVQGVRAPAVQGKNCWVGPIAPRFVNGVNKSHAQPFLLKRFRLRYRTQALCVVPHKSTAEDKAQPLPAGDHSSISNICSYKRRQIA